MSHLKKIVVFILIFMQCTGLVDDNVNLTIQNHVALLKLKAARDDIPFKLMIASF